MARLRKSNPASRYRSVEPIEMADIVGVSTRTLNTYTIHGLPRNADGSYDTARVFDWIEQRGRDENKPGGGGTLEKLQESRIERQIQLQDIIISAKKGEMISTELSERRLASRANSLRQYLTDGFPACAEYFVGRTVEELRVRLLDCAKKAMDAYIAGSVETDAETKHKPKEVDDAREESTRAGR